MAQGAQEEDMERNWECEFYLPAGSEEFGRGGILARKVSAKQTNCR